MYPRALPVIALRGGGLTRAQLRSATARAAAVGAEAAVDGAPSLFDVATAAGEEATRLQDEIATRRTAREAARAEISSKEVEARRRRRAADAKVQN